MTEQAREDPHPVYPGGPPCNPHCEGTWSTYHDGYADGYEAALRTPADGRHPDHACGQNPCPHIDANPERIR